MSSFKGTYFNYDLALVEPSAKISNFGHSFTPGTITAKNFVTISEATVYSISDLHFTFQGLSRSLNHIVLANSTAVGKATLTGKYRLTNGGDLNDFKLEISYPSQTSGNELGIDLVNIVGGLGLSAIPLPDTTAHNVEVGSSVIFKVTCVNTSIECDNNNHLYWPVEVDSYGTPDVTILGEQLSDVTISSGGGAVTLNSSEILQRYTGDFGFSFTAGSSGEIIKSVSGFKLNSLTFDVVITKASGSTPASAVIKSVTLNGCSFEKTLPDDSSASVTDVNIVVAPTNSVGCAFSESHKGIVLTPASAITITGADASNFDDPTISLRAGKDIVLEFTSLVSESSTTKEATYTTHGTAPLICSQYIGTAVQIFITSSDFDEKFHFLDKSKNEIANFVPGFTVYNSLGFPTEGKIVNFSADAGFTIPVVNEQAGSISMKYVRITDLYNLAINASSGSANVPDLADRLHALEVACRDTYTEEINQFSTGDAAILWATKVKWCPVDISGN